MTAGSALGLNLYDVMATSRIGRGRANRSEHGEDDGYWSPDRHRTISGEEAAELAPALAPLDPTSAYLFYDCQTDDARLVLTILGEAERFGAVLLNGADVTEILDEDGRASGVACIDGDSGERFEVRASNVVNATGVWADQIRPDEILTEEEIPRIAPSRGAHIAIPTDLVDTGKSAFVIPAGEERTVMVLPWYGQHPDRADRQRLRRRYQCGPAQRGGHQLPARRGQRLPRPGADPGGRDGRLRGGPPADLERRPEEVSGHLAQGRAV